MDYLPYYDQETYLFGAVNRRFHEQKYLTAFDFFCIIIWKANRAKTKLAKRLLAKGYATLEAAVYDLTSGLASQTTPKERLRFLWDGWGFYLPTATAILTVLYPTDFTVYDIRVCGSIGCYQELANISKFEKLWPLYLEFKQQVEKAVPGELSLRDKDRYLFAMSFVKQLHCDITQQFFLTAADD